MEQNGKIGNRFLVALKKNKTMRTVEQTNKANKLDTAGGATATLLCRSQRREMMRMRRILQAWLRNAIWEIKFFWESAGVKCSMEQKRFLQERKTENCN